MKPQLLKEVLIKDAHEDAWLQFRNPVQVLVAWSVNEVKAQLELIEKLSSQHHYYAAGYISYEASEAFDSAFITKAKQGSKPEAKNTMPLLCFGLYRDKEIVSELMPHSEPYEIGAWELATNKSDYLDNISNIKTRIENGETYQVNYTIRQQARFQGCPESFFSQLATSASYGALFDSENFTICSASPELFFSLRDGVITSKPMKGTAARGLGSVEDLVQKRRLFFSEKDRAENIMIVDMIRNDLSKIASPFTIKVNDQFKIEQHETVWQMTSTVTAKTSKSVTEIMSALFPCASITGAPKVKAMEIIDCLEETPRGIYTGTIGYIDPRGNAQFNVAIRTALINKEKITYGIGGGIVADSDANEEYKECMLKAKVISQAYIPEFSLIETLLWTKADAYFLLEEHLKRMSESAEYFNFLYCKNNILTKLAKFENKFTKGAYRLRVLLDKRGVLTITESEILGRDQSTDVEPIKVCVAPHPIDSQDPFLYHKTTHRQFYQQVLDACADFSDVLMWNENREITETSIANIVLKRGNKFLTPPIKCGLLAGTYRQYLLDIGEIEEAVILIDDIDASSELYRINSVRKWQKLSISKQSTPNQSITVKRGE